MAQTVAPAQRRTLVIACTAALAVLAGGAAYALADGPLDTDGGLGVCAPQRPDGVTLYYAVLLPNTGANAIDVWSVTATGTNLGSVELLIDPTGPDVGQAMGTMEWPADNADDAAQDIMARAVAPGDAAIEPGGMGQLLVAFTPQDAAAHAWVDRIEIRYASGWRDYTETFDGYRLEFTPSDSCTLG
ncbi:hypothetical protein [Demequina silvatica]|uniref:hypothetical protein n=1 Tax=Demequina silvatica TaxID=1638988 RepID=UPI00078358AE|nr:hypothetical protein [Demequina silvatica]